MPLEHNLSSWVAWPWRRDFRLYLFRDERANYDIKVVVVDLQTVTLDLLSQGAQLLKQLVIVLHHCLHFSLIELLICKQAFNLRLDL